MSKLTEYRRNQDGHLVLSLALGLLIAASGFFVWQHVQANKSATPSNNSKTQQVQKENPTPADPSEGGKYLVVKEWGVRVELPVELHGDIGYFENDVAYKNSGGPLRIDFTSRKFSAGNLKCAEIEGTEPRSLTSIYTEKEGDGGTLDPAPFTRIGNTDYYMLSTGCEEAIGRGGSAQDKQLLATLKKAITSTLQQQ